MPSPYVVKTYSTGTYQHIFNRGVEKRVIFQDDLDYRVFINLLRTAVIKPAGVSRRKNFTNDVQVVAFCLMPNHFHLLVHQLCDRGMIAFMRSIMNAYTRYFNEKYGRTGKLCEGTFKAKFIMNEAQLVQTSRYIHRNPARLMPVYDYAYSSLNMYKSDASSWLSSDLVLQQFSDNQEYMEFVLRGDTS